MTTKFTFQYGATNIEKRRIEYQEYLKFTFQYGATNIDPKEIFYSEGKNLHSNMVLLIYICLPSSSVDIYQFTFQYGATNIKIERFKDYFIV